MICKKFLVPVLALVACGLPAGASVVSYCDGPQASCTDPAAGFAVATSNLYTVDFTALTPVSGGYEDATSGLILYDYPLQESSGISESAGVVTDGSGIQVNLPSGTLVFAFDLFLPGGFGFQTIQVAIPGGSVTVTNSGQNASSYFIGATSDSAISSFIINGPHTLNVQISNFELQSTANNADTPEVGTLILIGAGLIGMRWMRRLPRRILRTPQTA